jgi:hypothetical protein
MEQSLYIEKPRQNNICGWHHGTPEVSYIRTFWSFDFGIMDAQLICCLEQKFLRVNQFEARCFCVISLLLKCPLTPRLQISVYCECKLP